VNAILSAVFDSYDEPKPCVRQDVDCEYLFVTDSEQVAEEAATQGWSPIVETYSGHPNRAAKRPKCCPWEYTDAGFTIWIDGSIRVTAPSFVTVMREIADPIAQFVHPNRGCVYDEADISLQMSKYASEPIAAQMETYTEHPRHWGLWCAGIIARYRTPEVEQFGKAWLAEIERWSFQDQVSEAPMLREHGLRPNPIPGIYFKGANPWLQYEGSGRH
jgi:hypothetical protein